MMQMQADRQRRQEEWEDERKIAKYIREYNRKKEERLRREREEDARMRQEEREDERRKQDNLMNMFLKFTLAISKG